MDKLTEYQKEFLLNYFFKNEDYAGWKSIATKLLETGQCTVAGEECIWIGGIGNFIETEKAEDFIGCTLYKFDLDYFLTTEWYREIRNDYASVLEQKKRHIEQECEEIAKI